MKTLTIADTLTVIGKNEECAVAKVADTEEATATFMLYGFKRPTFVRLSKSCHVALIDENGCEYYPHKHFLTVAVLEAFEALEKGDELVVTARAVNDARVAKYIDGQVSAEESVECKE